MKRPSFFSKRPPVDDAFDAAILRSEDVMRWLDENEERQMEMWRERIKKAAPVLWQIVAKTDLSEEEIEKVMVGYDLSQKNFFDRLNFKPESGENWREAVLRVLKELG